MIRGWFANSKEEWDKFKKLGVNIITTDEVYN